MVESVLRLEIIHGLMGNEKKEAFLLGGRIAFQIMLANLQSRRRWRVVSSPSRHPLHFGLSMRPLAKRFEFVISLSCLTSQRKNRILCGIGEAHINVHIGLACFGGSPLIWLIAVLIENPPCDAPFQTS